jgi:TonB family protein
MTRYLPFISVAIALHIGVAVFFWKDFTQNRPERGGSSGGRIAVSLSPYVAGVGSGPRLTEQTPSQHAVFDKHTGLKTGSGFGLKAGETGDLTILSQIRDRIEGAKRYPRLAMHRGIEGLAAVRFQLAKDGNLAHIELTESTGSSLLDKAALETVQRAAPFPYYPETIDVGIRFRAE